MAEWGMFAVVLDVVGMSEAGLRVVALCVSR